MRRFLSNLAFVSILLACAWNVAAAGGYGASVSIDRLYPSTWYWGAAPKELSQHWGTQTGQDRLRFHQNLGFCWQNYGGLLGTSVNTWLAVDAAARLAERSWLKLGITPFIAYYDQTPSPSVDLDVYPDVSLAVNAYNPDFLVASRPGDYSGPGLVIDGRAGYSPQWPKDISTWLRVRGPWTWCMHDWTFEAGPRWELSRSVYDPGALRGTQEIGLQVLGILGTRAEEAQLHPGAYLERRYSGQVGLDISSYDEAFSDTTGFWTRDRRLDVQADAKGWLSIWRGLLVEPALSVGGQWDRWGGRFHLDPLLGMAYVGRVSSSGYLVSRLSLDFGNVLGKHLPIPFISASLAWHG